MILLNLKRLFALEKLSSLATDFLSPLGLFTVLVTITSFFDSLKTVNDHLKTPTALVLLFVSGVVYAIARNWPKTSYIYKLHGKDVRIKMFIGDLFDNPGAIVVPINNSFDVDLGGTVMNTNSVQAQVIRHFFDSKMHGLQKSLNSKLPSVIPCKIGSTIAIDKNGRKFYFLASSVKINDKHVATTKETLTTALIGLWVYLSQYGTKGQITIPLIGTGNARLSSPRSEVFKEIVQSFIASCYEKSYCDVLTIAINGIDVHNCNIDIDELDEFLRYSCRHYNVHKTVTPPIGTPIA